MEGQGREAELLIVTLPCPFPGTLGFAVASSYAHGLSGADISQKSGGNLPSLSTGVRDVNSGKTWSC